MLVLGNVKMWWGPLKLEDDALSLQGTHRLSGPVCQGTDTWKALDGLKSRLGVRYNNDAVEPSQGRSLLASKMDPHKLSLHSGMGSLKVHTEGVAHQA